jgi:hypothetical protein
MGSDQLVARMWMGRDAIQMPLSFELLNSIRRLAR